jgi:lipoate-protein ligase A
MTLDVIRLPELEPATLPGLQIHLLDTIGQHDAEAILLLFQIPGEVISIGRYHLYPGPETRGGITGYRRLTGGRIINPAAGWICCSLLLPSRRAFPGGDGQRAGRMPALRPDQVMNRGARGAIAALRAMGADCFYPGRDAITCAGRELAMCTFEESSAGALLFELFIATQRGLGVLPSQMERFDPGGCLRCRFDTPATCTNLAQELGRIPDFGELADRLAAGYRQQFGSARSRELTQSEMAAAQTKAAELTHWLAGRQPASSLDLIGRQSIQLGSMEVRLAATEGRIDRAEFYGDFIANSSALARFEQSLEGQRLDLMTLTSAALQTYGDGSNFILGCGDLTNIARLVLSAQ